MNVRILGSFLSGNQKKRIETEESVKIQTARRAFVRNGDGDGDEDEDRDGGWLLIYIYTHIHNQFHPLN